MELIYSASRPKAPDYDSSFEESSICCLSVRNIIAFTAYQDLGDNESISGPTYDGECCVYVCDINKPWDVHLVARVGKPVIWMAWDTDVSGGHRLALLTSQGKCQVWVMKAYLLNHWTCQHTSMLEGENVIAVNWFHSGIKREFRADMKDSILYQDKIVKIRFKPTVSKFGGRAAAGFVALTSSGTIFACMLVDGVPEMVINSENLGVGRNHLALADITHLPSGELLVAVSDGNLTSAIQCFKVSIKSELDQLNISCHPTASLFAKCHTDKALRANTHSRLTHIKFIPAENGDVLLLSAGHGEYSHLELWNFISTPIALHHFYQQQQPMLGQDSSFSSHSWIHKATVTHGSLPLSIAAPKFPVSSSQKTAGSTYPGPGASPYLFQYIAVGYRDGAVKLIHRHNFQSISTTHLDTGIDSMETETGIDEKQTSTQALPHMIHLQQTTMGCSLVGLDQYGCLYVMRAVNTRDPLTHVPPIYLVCMLEYCIMVGHDPWDILATLKPATIELVTQKLSDNFVKQSPNMADLLYSRFMAVKGSLFKHCTSGQFRATDCHCQIMLHSLSDALKSMVRPKVISQDSNPTDICSISFELDIDKVILTLKSENKDFTVEPAHLQAVQPLLQWVVDLSLHLLASIPNLQTHSSFPGSVLLTDAGALCLLRELLILIRVWSSFYTSCQPHMTTTAPNIDMLSHIYKLLTKTWMLRRDGKSLDTATEDGVIDDCCMLPTQVMIPPADQGMFGNMNYNSSILFQSQPQKYILGDLPRHASSAALPVSLSDGTFQSKQRKDIIRQIYLGVEPVELVRECSRCSCVSLLGSTTTASPVLAWEYRWARCCPCQGHWKLVSNHAVQAINMQQI